VTTPAESPVCQDGLVAFLHFDDAVGDQSVRFAVHRDRRFLVRRFDQAEHLPRRLVVPVLQLFHAVLFLRGRIGLMGLGHGVGGQTRNVLVNVHE